MAEVNHVSNKSMTKMAAVMVFSLLRCLFSDGMIELNLLEEHERTHSERHDMHVQRVLLFRRVEISLLFLAHELYRGS